MRDAVGGTVTIGIIIFFILLVNGYLAFNVNYTKAFNVKSQIISIIEKNEGHTDRAEEQIKEYIASINYSVNQNMMQGVLNDEGFICPGSGGSDNGSLGYCYKPVAADTETTDTYRGTYYQVVTFVSMDVPVLSQLLPMLADDLFRVNGETKLVTSFGTDSETT